ncbi:MAG: ChbG/HpnK family deacetylase [Syntrophomonas sp.]
MISGEIIINADDFGESSQKNRAIIQSFNQGLVSSTTIMANGEAFEEACQMAHENRLAKRIGVHVNLFTGKPLTEKIKDCPRLVNRDGEFDFQLKVANRNWLPMSPGERTAVFQEITGQINLCRKNGLPIFHADSHHHQHNEAPLIPVMIHALRSSHVSYIRPLRNMGDGICVPKKCYKRIINYRLRLSGMMGVDLFGDIDDFAAHQHCLVKHRSYRIELMCHPQYDNRSQIVDLDSQPLQDKIQNIRTMYPGFSSTFYARLNEEVIIGHIGKLSKVSH